MKYESPEPLSQSSNPFYGLSWPLVVGVIVCLGLLTLTTWHTSVDPDTYMHLTVGQWMLAHGAIPRTDIYSYTLFGQPWTAHEWLSECIMALIYGAGGWTALVLMTALAVGGTLALLLRFLLKRMIPIYAIFFTALAYSALASHLLIRPHVLSWPILVAWVGALINASEKHVKPPLYLLGLMVLWANLHGSFVFGLAIAIPLGAQALWVCPALSRSYLLKRWIAFWLLAVMACMLTPLGWEGLVFPFTLFKLAHLGAITEWMPYQFASLSGLEIVVVTYLFLAMMGYFQINVIGALLIVGLLHQALTHNRYASLFGLITPMILASSFGARYRLLHGLNQEGAPSKLDSFFERLAGYATKKAVLFSAALILGVTLLAQRHQYHEPSKTVFPVAAVDFAQGHGISGHLLNAYEFGGYLISRGIPVFIDGRADLYDEKVLGPYLDAVRDGSPTALDAVIREYGITWVLLRPDSPARAYFDTRDNWQNRYEDEAAVIFTLKSLLPAPSSSTK